MTLLISIAPPNGAHLAWMNVDEPQYRLYYAYDQIRDRHLYRLDLLDSLVGDIEMTAIIPDENLPSPKDYEAVKELYRKLRIAIKREEK